jgi:hypothetical protein
MSKIGPQAIGLNRLEQWLRQDRRLPASNPLDSQLVIVTRWSGREDLNLRHPAPKAGALPGCATPRLEHLEFHLS